jgi:hypothetical protein
MDDLSSRSSIFDHWKDKLSELGFFIDWGEPGCWSCGFHYDGRYDIKGLSLYVRGHKMLERRR